MTVLPVRARLRAATAEPRVATRRVPRPSRAARALALAWAVDEAVAAGLYESYAEMADALGITRARMAQVRRLRWLPVGVQERVLLGEVAATERGLRVS